MLLLAWPPVRRERPNHEVVMLQPRTVIPPYLGSAVNCYVSTSFFLTHSALIRPPPTFYLGGGCPHLSLATLPSNSAMQPHSIICPTGHHLSPPQHTKTHWSLPHILTPLRPSILLHSYHTCRISNAVNGYNKECIEILKNISAWFTEIYHFRGWTQFIKL